MKVWIVNPFDNLPPEGLRAQRYWLMAQALVRGGHEVVYWSADFSHAHKRPRDVKALEGEYGGISLRLVHEPPYQRNICLKRLGSPWWFARNWLAAAKSEINGHEAAKARKPDILVVSSPPLSLGAVARTFCRKAGVKLVIDVQDAWPETFARVVPAVLLAPLRLVARRNYLGADAITAVATRYLEMVRAYGATCPVHLCYLGIDSSSSPAVGHVPGHDPSLFRLVYIGNMSRSYDLATVVDAVRGMSGVTLDLAGAGPDEPSLRMRSEGCERIRFHGYLEENNLRKLLAGSDAGIIPMFDDSCVGVPGKLGDYSAAGLPVVNSLTGETASLLERYSAGVAYTAGDSDSFASAVDEVRKLEKRSALDLSVEFDARKLYNEYSNFLERFLEQ